MSGALTERVFVTKLSRVGFEEIELSGRVSFGIREAAGYPLFTPDLIELMERLIPASKHEEVAVSVIVRAVKPA